MQLVDCLKYLKYFYNFLVIYMGLGNLVMSKIFYIIIVINFFMIMKFYILILEFLFWLKFE